MLGAWGAANVSRREAGEAVGMRWGDGLTTLARHASCVACARLPGRGMPTALTTAEWILKVPVPVDVIPAARAPSDHIHCHGQLTALHRHRAAGVGASPRGMSTPWRCASGA